MANLLSKLKRDKDAKVFPLEKEPLPFIGVDLGKEGDFTAFAIVMAHPVRRIVERNGNKRVEETVLYRCPRLERPNLGTDYETIVGRIIDLVVKLGDGRHAVSLVVDAVGPGIGITPWIKQEFAAAVEDHPGVRMRPAWVWTTFSGTHHHDGTKLIVPRRELVTATKRVMQQQRFEAARMPLRDVLQQEMRSFSVKQNPRTGNETYEHYRENDKDDLVSAVAMPLWVAETYILPDVKRRHAREREQPGSVFAPEPTPEALDLPSAPVG